MRPSARLIAVARLGASAGAPVAAQSHRASADTVTGTVFDSLDRESLDGLGARRPDARAPWRNVALATPSFDTVWRVACGGPLPPDARGILVGSARLAGGPQATATSVTATSVNAAGPVLLAGAVIEAGWSGASGAGAACAAGVRTTRTDSLGTWALCDVPTSTEFALAARSDSFASGVVRLAPDARRVRRVRLLLGRTGDRRGAVVRGRVVDETGFPVADARVSLEGATSEPARTSRWGEFQLGAVPLGSRMLSVQALGHVPVAVDGRPTSLARLDDVPFATLAGVEAYAGRADAPQRLARVIEGRDRAVLAVWTEEVLRP